MCDFSLIITSITLLQVQKRAPKDSNFGQAVKQSVHYLNENDVDVRDFDYKNRGDYIRFLAQYYFDY